MVPQSNVIADIGSDHALLPIALVLNGKVTRAYASEVNEGPYEATVKNIEKHGVSNYVTAVLSDGISELEKDVTTISICGMGGSLIVDILDKDKEKLEHVTTLVLEPNNNEENVRIWLMNNGYKVVFEKLIEEDNRFYEIIKAERGNVEYSKEELFFGPILLQEKSETFVTKWNNHRAYLLRIMENINDKECYNYKLLESIVSLINNVI
jgi:tRNA (adenine22-N1)-methyltransferase